MNSSFYLITIIIIVIIVEATNQQLAYSSSINNSTNNINDQKYDYDKDIDVLIGEGLQECSDLKNDSCIAVMNTLNNICQVAYFPNCFGNEAWTPFMNHLEKMIKEGDIQREDPYLTLNNEHFGNDSIQFQ